MFKINRLPGGPSPILAAAYRKAWPVMRAFERYDAYKGTSEDVVVVVHIPDIPTHGFIFQVMQGAHTLGFVHATDEAVLFSAENLYTFR